MPMNHSTIGDFESRLFDLSLRYLEEELRIPNGYISALARMDSDFDFIVKLSVVIEATLTRAIALEESAARPYATAYKNISSMSQGKRLEIAEKIGLVAKAERTMLFRIANVRNDFVHDIKNLTGSLSNHLRSLEPAILNGIATAVLSVGIPGSLKKVKDPEAVDRFPESFRQDVMLAAFPTLLHLAESHRNKQREREHVEWRSRREREIGRSLPPRVDGYLADKLAVLDFIAGSQPDSP